MVALLVASLWVGPAEVVVPRDPEGLFARIHTNRGTITVLLELRRTPLATASFVGLAEGTIENPAFPPGRPFYDGSPFHRVVPGHVIQAGAPASEEATSPGYVYPNEIHAHLSHDRAGVLGVANSGPHTNSAQFYITLDDRAYLDGIYIAFGEVVEGMEVVHSIQQGDRVDSVRVVRVGDEAEAFRPDTESFHEMVRRAEARALEHEARRTRAEEAWVTRHLPELEDRTGGLGIGSLETPVCPPAGDGEVREAGDGPARLEAPSPGTPETVRVCYRGTALRYRGHLLEHEGPPLDELSFASGPDGAPGLFDPPRVFSFVPEATTLNPGLDRILSDLSPGEGAVIVVPSELGYGPGGHFAPERPGESRFVIPPNTLLVYEVEILPTRR